MPDQKFIAAAWEGYRKMVVPKTASPTQVEGTHQAFFAGAACIFSMLMSRLSDEEDATPEDLEMLGSIDKEIEDFGRGLDAELLSPAIAEALRRKPS